jgi:hypothetical protein
MTYFQKVQIWKKMKKSHFFKTALKKNSANPQIFYWCHFSGLEIAV